MKRQTGILCGILLTFFTAFPLAARVPAAHLALMEAEAKKEHVPFSLVLLLCDSESQGHMSALNKNLDKHGNVTSIDVGYFQLNSKCWEYFAWKFYPEGEFDPYNPACNIKVGIRYFASLYRRFDDPEIALAAYKGGPACYDRGGDNPRARALAKRVLLAWVSGVKPFETDFFG